MKGNNDVLLATKVTKPDTKLALPGDRGKIEVGGGFAGLQVHCLVSVAWGSVANKGAP